MKKWFEEHRDTIVAIALLIGLVLCLISGAYVELLKIRAAIKVLEQ